MYKRQNHTRHRQPAPGEQHCYGRAILTVTSPKRSLLIRSVLPAARDASGDLNFGSIDIFRAVELGGEDAWELGGDWGEFLIVEPTVVLVFD